MSESKLKPANENPWYVLMTLYGEQTGEEVDEALHEQNRAAWNGWAALDLTREQRDEIAKSTPLPAPGEWGRKAKEIEELHRAEMVRRNGEGFVYPGLPDHEADIDLSSIAFLNPLVATGLFFSRAVSFDSATFIRGAWFLSATFSEHARFNSAEFTGPVRFAAAIFNGDARFDSAIINGLAQFDFAVFKGDTQFENAAFIGEAQFASAKFSRNAGFDSVRFICFAEFSGVTFAGDALFGFAEFSMELEFGSASFSGISWFESAMFRGHVAFSSTVFKSFSYFANARFGSLDKPCDADFTDCQFQKPTDFREASFSLYPNFTGTILHEKTAFSDDPAFWPQGPQPFPALAKSSCAVIRHNLGKQGLPEAEHFFYRREMGFAGQIGGWWQRLPYRVFGWLSDYGYSIERPSWALFWVWLVPSIVFAATWITGQPVHDLEELGRGVALSFANLFTIFGLHKLWFNAAWLEHLWWPLKVLGGVQTVLSLPLLFFLGLGLRTRFRLR